MLFILVDLKILLSPPKQDFENEQLHLLSEDDSSCGRMNEKGKAFLFINAKIFFHIWFSKKINWKRFAVSIILNQ